MLFLGTETALVVRKNLGRTEMVMPRSPLLFAFIHCLRTAFSVSLDLGSLGSSDDSTRWAMATLSRFFSWRGPLVNVKADTLTRWRRKGFHLFWRWKSKPTGRPPLPKDLRQLIRQMAADNVSWGEERIADELTLKLGIQVSPRAVGKYLQRAARAPDPQQRWLTFIRDHATTIVARLLRCGHGQLPYAVRIRDHGTGNAANSSSQRDGSSNR